MIWAGERGGLSRVVDIGSAGLFAGAAGYSTLMLASPAAGALAAAMAFVGAHRALGLIDGSYSFVLPDFAIGNTECGDEELLLTELAELLLTETVGSEGDELLLEDSLAPHASNSRVIRLFDPKSFPSAGELHHRIERHLSRPPDFTPADATSELHQALADLRGSLR